jgi:hypothetical protein
MWTRPPRVKPRRVVRPRTGTAGWVLARGRATALAGVVDNRGP